jgi:DNA-binding transcriptional LysR family regulator
VNSKQLLSFSRIVELGSQARAADALHISESALSRRIASLEHELGVKLFTRDKVQLVPTPLGERFSREVDRVLASLDQLPRIAREMATGQRQRFRLVTIQRLANALAIPSLAELQDAHDLLDVSIDIEPQRTMERWMRAKPYDVAICPAIPGLDEDAAKLLVSVPAVAALPSRHPLAGRDRLGVEELAGERLALTAADSLMRRQVEQIFAAAGTPLSPIVEVSDTVLACQLAADGHAATVCDPFAPAAFLAGVRLVPIEPAFRLDFVLLGLDRDPAPLAETFGTIVTRMTVAYLDRVGIGPLAG